MWPMPSPDPVPALELAFAGWPIATMVAALMLVALVTLLLSTRSLSGKSKNALRQAQGERKNRGKSGRGSARAEPLDFARDRLVEAWGGASPTGSY
jgi:hypothetical protein